MLSPRVGLTIFEWSPELYEALVVIWIAVQTILIGNKGWSRYTKWVGDGCCEGDALGSAR
jgi:hypothetical protein